MELEPGILGNVNEVKENKLPSDNNHQFIKPSISPKTRGKNKRSKSKSKTDASDDDEISGNKENKRKNLSCNMGDIGFSLNQELINSLLKRVSSLERLTTAQNETLSMQQNEINRLNKELNDIKLKCVDSNNKQLTRNWATIIDQHESVTTPPSAEKISVLNCVNTEQAEKEYRSNKILIFGVPESNKTTIEGKKEDDINYVKKLFRDLNILPDKVHSTFRFKKNDTNKSKIAPLVITLSDKDNRNQMLKNAKNLKNFNEYKNIYLNPFLTPAEFIIDKNLRDERKSLNEKAEKEKQPFRFKIRGNKIVKFKTNQTSI